MLFFNRSSVEFSLLHVARGIYHHGNLTLPAPFRRGSPALLQIQDIQLSENGRSFGVIFRLFRFSSRAFIQRYSTGLIQGRPARLEVEKEVTFPFVYSQFSTEGDAAAAVFTVSNRQGPNANDTFHVMALDRSVKGFATYQPLVSKDLYTNQTHPLSATISYDGRALAVGGASLTDVNGLRSPCSANETRFRLSLTADDHPASMTWNLTTIRTIHGSIVTAGIVKQCNYCYVDTIFARTNVIEQTCMTMADANCLSFQVFHDTPPMAPNSGYDSFLLKPNGTDIANVSVEVLAIGKGFTATQDVIIGADDPRCDVTPPLGCPKLEEEFLLHLLHDQYAAETRWEILVNDLPFRQSPDYFHDYAPDPHMIIECLPVDACLNFTVYDSRGDGMCCSSGYGEYIGFYQGKEIFRGGSFGYRQSHLFGTCSE